VKSELFPGQAPPPITNRRFYTADVDVRNHRYRTSVKKNNAVQSGPRKSEKEINRKWAGGAS